MTQEKEESHLNPFLEKSKNPMTRIYNFFVLCTIVGLMLISGCAATNVAHVPEGPAKNMLVLDFKDESSYTYGRIRYDASQLMEQALAQRENVHLITRETWKPLMVENTLNELSEANMLEKAVELGKIAGADFVIIGKIYRFVVNSDIVDKPLSRRQREYSATAYVNAQVIDVAQSQIILREKALGTADKTAPRIFTRGSFGVNAINERSLLNQSLREAIRSLSYKIVRQI